MMPLPVRQPGGKKYERDLREIFDRLDKPVEDLTKNFANMNMGAPKRMKTGNIPWGLGREPRRYMGLVKRPWGVYIEIERNKTGEMESLLQLRRI